MLSRKKRLLRRMGRLLGKLEGVEIAGVLKLLQQDHYLDRDDTGHYKFRFPLIRRWWRFDRSL